MIPLKDDVPTRRFPIVTVTLIAINVIVYLAFEQGLWELGALGNERVIEFGAIPIELTHPGTECAAVAGGSAIQCGPDSVVGGQAPTWITAVTSMFLHGSLLHLGGNMLFLWIFGNNIEDSMNRLLFVVFYVLGGLAALGLQVAMSPDSAVPTVGASGAIAAVLVLGLWFLLQLLPAFSAPLGDTGGGVAYFAHIGGFLFGLLVIKLIANNVQEDYDQAHRIPVY